MGEAIDFERAWLGKLARSIEDKAGEPVRDRVMEGHESLSSASGPTEIIAWTRGMMDRLESSIDTQSVGKVLAACACEYPKKALRPIRNEYQASGDLNLAHTMLRRLFESFLRDNLGLDNDLIGDIVGRGWGLAGIRDGNTITATKIPKSGNLVAYMKEEDPDKQREYYCHCPRIREMLRTGETLSAAYCYCGAGFYKKIWEEILQQPVKVEVLESLLKGDSVCKFAIHLR